MPRANGGRSPNLSAKTIADLLSHFVQADFWIYLSESFWIGMSVLRIQQFYINIRSHEGTVIFLLSEYYSLLFRRVPFLCQSWNYRMNECMTYCNEPSILLATIELIIEEMDRCWYSFHFYYPTQGRFDFIYVKSCAIIFFVVSCLIKRSFIACSKKILVISGPMHCFERKSALPICFDPFSFIFYFKCTWLKRMT